MITRPYAGQILPLQTLSESGKPPKSRIANVSDANTICDAVIYAGQERSRFNAQLRGMFDGNPPYSPGKLRNEAQAWRANINFLEGKAASSAALVPFYDLFSSGTYYAQVETNRGGTEEEKEYFSEVITEEFDRMLKRYDGFDFNMQRGFTDLVRYGRMFLMWPDKTDVRFECVQQHKVYVPDGTDAYTGNLEAVVIRSGMRVDKLYRFIEDAALAKLIGWNVKGTVQAIINAMPEIEADSASQYNYEWLQQRIKDRDLYEGIRSSIVSVRHLLVKEFSGRVSHYIIEEFRGGFTEPAVAQGKKDSRYPTLNYFLFESVDRFDDFNQCLAGLFLETSDGSWNGAQGLGHDIYSMMSLKDRVKCAGIDNTFLRTGITLQAVNASSAQKVQLMRYGPINVLPPGFAIQNATILGDVEAPITMDRYLDEVVTNNTGVFRQRQEKAEGNPRTAREVSLQYQTQAVLSNSVVNRFYCGLDKFYCEMYSRAANPNLSREDTCPGVKMALEFQDRCKRRGVPIEALVDVDKVSAARNAGNGSLFMRQQNIGQTMQFLPMMPEDGKQNFLAYALASINGQSTAELFNPKRARLKLPDDQRAWATIENTVLKDGGPVQWTPSQNNVIHAQTHLEAGSIAAQTLQQGGDPHQIAAFMESLGQHIAVHLQELSKDATRKDEYKALEQQFQQFGKLTDEIIGRVKDLDQQREQAMQQQARAAAVMNGNDPNTQLKAATVASDIRMKQAKTDADISRKQQKARQDLALKDARTAADIIRKRQGPFNP